jgi:hypothetical protein
MRAIKAKLLRRQIKLTVAATGETIPYRGLQKGHHGNLVNTPKSFRGIYCALKKGLIKLGQPTKATTQGA